MGKFDFIKFYMDEFDIPADCRTENGFAYGKWIKEAVPCHCGEKFCKGWIMISPRA